MRNEIQKKRRHAKKKTDQYKKHKTPDADAAKWYNRAESGYDVDSSAHQENSQNRKPFRKGAVPFQIPPLASPKPQPSPEKKNLVRHEKAAY